MNMSNRKDQHFITPHRSTEMFVSVNQGSTHWQDAEKVRQLRSRFVQILNVPQRVRLRVFTRRGLAGQPF
jgi:hypothetical protein